MSKNLHLGTKSAPKWYLIIEKSFYSVDCPTYTPSKGLCDYISSVAESFDSYVCTKKENNLKQLKMHLETLTPTLKIPQST